MSTKIIFVVLSILMLINIVNSDQNNRAIDIEWGAIHPPFDPNISDKILDPELCAKQMKYLIVNDTSLLMTCKYCNRILFIICTRYIFSHRTNSKRRLIDTPSARIKSNSHS